MDVQRFTDYAGKVTENCSRVIVGKEDAIKLVLTAFICSGHVLLEDVPGTGKTTLLRAFAKTVGGDFKRIQFTPDLLPSDLTGLNIYNQKTGEFNFRRGPLFASVVLADELNRATPRTQSSLLEAMEERQITVDGESYPLAEPFFVMATQNPIESYGTFPLPEAQVDRFFLRLSLGYMDREQELSVLSRPDSSSLITELEQAVSREETAWIKAHYRDAAVSSDVQNYIMAIVTATRTSGHFALGVSTRGALALYKASQVHALFEGRGYVLPEDVLAMARCTLCHRLGISAAGKDQFRAFDDMLHAVPVPTEVF